MRSREPGEISWRLTGWQRQHRKARSKAWRALPDHAALLAVLDGEVVGCGTYERVSGLLVRGGRL